MLIESLEKILNILAIVAVLCGAIFAYLANNSFFMARNNRKKSAFRIMGLDIVQIFMRNQYSDEGNKYRNEYFRLFYLSFLSFLLGFIFFAIKEIVIS